MDLLSDHLNDGGYRARMTAWVACMNRDGLPIVQTSGGVTAGGWTYGTATTPRAKYLDSLAGENDRDMIEATCLERSFDLRR